MGYKGSYTEVCSGSTFRWTFGRGYGRAHTYVCFLRAAADLSFWGLGILDEINYNDLESCHKSNSFLFLGFGNITKIEEIKYFEKE